MKKDAAFKSGEILVPSKNEFADKALRVIGELPDLIISSGMNSDYVIDEALSRIGALFDASRVYVMLDEKDGKYLRNTHEWVSEKIGPVMFSWPLYDYEYDIPSLKTIIAENEIFFGRTAGMPQDLNNVLNKQGVLSFMIAPLIRDGNRAGIVGMDFCESPCEFTAHHGEILRYSAGLISMTIERKQFHIMRAKLNTIRDCIQSLEPYIETAADDEMETLSRPSKPTTLLDAERRIIIETLELYNGNKLKTAKHLGLTWPSLDRRCKKLGIEARRK